KVVGTWYCRLPPSGDRPRGALVVLDYARDRTFSSYINGHLSVIRTRWAVRDGKLIYTYDLDLGLVDRARQLLPAGFPGAVAPNGAIFVVERLTADEFIFRGKYENIVRMTRTPPE